MSQDINNNHGRSTCKKNQEKVNNYVKTTDGYQKCFTYEFERNPCLSKSKKYVANSIKL